MPAEIGQPAPEFALHDQERHQVRLEDLRGNKAIVVFIPYPFTGICTAESCAIRDDLGSLGADGTKAVVITCHALPTNAHWAQENDLNFPVLSDFWPHGEVARAYGCFDERRGTAMRYSYVLDAEGIVREIIKSDELGTAREHALYEKALTAI